MTPFILWIFLQVGPVTDWMPAKDMGSEQDCLAAANSLVWVGLPAVCHPMDYNK